MCVNFPYSHHSRLSERTAARTEMHSTQSIRNDSVQIQMYYTTTVSAQIEDCLYGSKQKSINDLQLLVIRCRWLAVTPCRWASIVDLTTAPKMCCCEDESLTVHCHYNYAIRSECLCADNYLWRADVLDCARCQSITKRSVAAFHKDCHFDANRAQKIAIFSVFLLRSGSLHRRCVERFFYCIKLLISILDSFTWLVIVLSMTESSYSSVYCQAMQNSP